MKRLILISASIFLASGAFAQSRCVTAPVNITGNQMTLTSSGSKSVTKDNVYVYYTRKHRRHMDATPLEGVSAKYHSYPLKLSCTKTVSAVPETYNVSLTTPQTNVSVCPDSALNLTANINIEKVSSYTGNYPDRTSENNTYRKVSKREYKMISRKMRKIKRNENKVARRTGTRVEASTERA